MDLFACCACEDVHIHTLYQPQSYGSQSILHCRRCDIYLSETFATPIAGLKTPLNRTIVIHKARDGGMSLNATAQTHNVSKKSVINWKRRFGKLNPH